MELHHVAKALEKNRYTVRLFSTAAEAADYLAEAVRGQTVGFGDSETLDQMGLDRRLAACCTVRNPKRCADTASFLETARACLTTDVFITSANALTEDGVLVNLDGTGNRVAGSLFGHRKVYYVVGRNKLAPDLEQAVWRVRNIAAPKNAHRLGLRTPCALHGDRCYDCSSPDRICNGLLIALKKMNDMEMEVLLIDQDLGF